MASHSARSNAGGSAAEVQRLEAELEELRAYKVVAERNLEEMGFNLQAALKQGWVSKRAEARRKRLEKKKATEAAKRAKNDEYEAWLRNERKKVGLLVKDPTPTPSEAAYLERVAEAAREEKAERLRNRVRRMSHQLLIAAAIRKQYREINMADHSGHFVPGGNDPSGPLQHRRFDARSETSLSATEAMARSFRNWANKEKQNRFRSRSHTPETTVVSSRTTGPEDSLSGSGSDSSFTDDDISFPEGPGIAGPQALRAVVYDPPSDEDDITDAGKELGGLADLDLDDVSDEVMATAYAMLATAEHRRGEGDWADTLADDVLKILLAENFNTPSSISSSDTDTDSQIEPEKEVKHNFQASLDPRKHGNTETLTKKVKKALRKNKISKTETEILHGIRKAIKHLNKQQSQQMLTPEDSSGRLPEVIPASAPKLGQKPPGGVKAKQKKQRKQKPKQQQQKPRISSLKDNKGPSQRAPNKPAAPSRSVYDPLWWRVNVKDPYDGLWASKVLPPKQPTDDMETGFVTWKDQEKRFPYLDKRLELQEIYSSVIFNPDEANKYTWDPFNRAVTERKTKRRPLRLGPVTIHSLARWKAYEFGHEYSRDPVRQPDNPSAEDKRRPLSSTTFSKPRPRPTVRFAPGVKANMAVSTDDTPIASVHYPLKSPSATSISKPDGHALEEQQPTAYATTGAPAPSPAAYSQYEPETPTVALYEAAASSEGSGDEEQDKKLEAFLQELHGGASSSSTPNENGKRTGTEDASSPIAATKKRRIIGGDVEKENGAEFETLPQSEASGTPGSAKKSVRFDVGEGPSYGMRFGARRALGRYGRTSSRRGPYR